MQLCFLMQLNPKLSMEAGKNCLQLAEKLCMGQHGGCEMSLVGCRELLLPDYFKELEASPGAPAFLPLGLGLSYLSNHDISQSTSNQPVSLFFSWSKGEL